MSIEWTRERSALGCVAVGLAVTLAACSGGGGGGQGDQSTGGGGAQPKPVTEKTALPTFEIDAVHGYGYKFPKAQAPAGFTTVKLVNSDQKLPHQAQLMRLHKGVSFAAFKKTLLSAGNLGAVIGMADPVGGPNAIGPGHSASVVANLAPGATYAVVCSIPAPDGKPHFMHGMLGSFTVGDTPWVTRAPRTASTITLKDFSFTVPPGVDWSGPVTVTDRGREPHEMAVLGPAPGKTMADVRKALESPSAGRPPYRDYGGVSALAPGGSQATDLHLPKGTYLLTCFVTDPKTHEPHFMLGMTRQITVS